MAKKKKYVLVEEQDAVQEGRTGGCMKPILICVLILFAVAIIAPNRGSDTKTSTAKAKASATVKPTATPAPTATPVPDFPAMSTEDAAAALSMYYAGSDFEYISVFEFDGAVSINVKLKPFLTARYAVRDCCIFSLNVSRYLFLHPEVKSLIICYDADGEDKYGNSTVSRAVEILLYRDTATKINYDRMLSRVWSSTKDYLDITDRYFVHQSLSNGVYD